MAAGVYSIVAKGVTVIGANTMVYVHSGTTATLKILRCSLSQGDKTAASEQQSVALYTQLTTFPTLVTATPFQMGGVNDAANSCALCGRYAFIPNPIPAELPAPSN